VNFAESVNPSKIGEILTNTFQVLWDIQILGYHLPQIILGIFIMLLVFLIYAVLKISGVLDGGTI